MKNTPDASKADIVKAKKQYRKSKNDLKKTYNELKKDKTADKGKSLYSKGKTITGNAEVVRNTAIASSIGLVAAHFYKIMVIQKKRNTLQLQRLEPRQ